MKWPRITLHKDQKNIRYYYDYKHIEIIPERPFKIRNDEMYGSVKILKRTILTSTLLYIEKLNFWKGFYLSKDDLETTILLTDKKTNEKYRELK